MDWSDFKDIATALNLSIQVEKEYANKYSLCIYNGPRKIECIVLKSDPRNADQEDFEDNYLDDADGLIADQILHGSTVCFSGTATTTPANVPSSAGNVISEAGIQNYGDSDLLISFDAGTTFFTLAKNEFISWTVRGNMRQLVLKTLASTALYSIILNRENS